ncbi:hypothetical protein QQ045_023842 [Rhodiola kirilowii]
MASVFLYHVVGDLTVGKPEMMEFVETDTIEAAIRAIGDSTEGGITVWKKRSVHPGFTENSEMRQQRFVGILNSLDIVSFLARDWCLNNQEMALKTPVSEVVVPDSSLLKEVDPATRLIDALELMKQGVRRLLVPKSVGWKGMSKRFSILYNGRWLNNIDTSSGDSANAILNTNKPTTSYSTAIRDTFCCLSREDVIRFLIDCLGALAPLPLASISSLETINPNYSSIEASMPAINVTHKLPDDPTAVAIVEHAPDGQYRIIGEISASKLWKCDYLAAAWALANLTAGQFVMGVEDSMTSRNPPNFSVTSANGETLTNGGGARKPKKLFSSRSIGFQNNPTSLSLGIRSMYRGRSAPLTCKVTNSLAAVMAQLLSHRASHVWVTEDDNEDVLVGIVGYADILAAVTKLSSPVVPSTQSYECFGTKQN